MSIECPRCRRKYDVKELDSEKKVVCTCGHELDLSLIMTPEDFLVFFENDRDRRNARLIQKDAEMISRMILDEGYSRPDIEIAKKRLRDLVGEWFPDKLNLYSMIYEGRFNRLWEQFRKPDNQQ